MEQDEIRDYLEAFFFHKYKHSDTELEDEERFDKWFKSLTEEDIEAMIKNAEEISDSDWYDLKTNDK